MAGAEQYERRIRGAISALWNGSLTGADFLSAMNSIVTLGLDAAFAEGTRQAGIEKEDWTDEEIEALAEFTDNELQHIEDLAAYIQINSKANGGKLQPILDQKLPLWSARYRDVVTRAKTMAGANKKYLWVLGPTEHCSTCERLAGQVRRGSFWQSHVMPQSPPNEKLECGGWRCQCTLVETDDRASRGRLPRTP